MSFYDRVVVIIASGGPVGGTLTKSINLECSVVFFLDKQILIQLPYAINRQARFHAMSYDETRK